MTEFTFAGFTGTGKNKAECMADIEKQITEVMGRDYKPRIVHGNGELGVVWMTPNGVHSSVYRKVDQNAPSPFFIAGCVTQHAAKPGASTVIDALRLIRLHLATLHCDIGSDNIPAVIENDPGLVQDWMRWVAFLRAVRAFLKTVPWEKRLDADVQSNAHRYGCEHQHEHFFKPVNLHITIE